MTAQVRSRVGSTVGLHARPVSIFTRAVRATGIPVTIARIDGDPVNAASPLLVMSLGIAYGDEVVLASDAPAAEEALASLAELLTTELDVKTVDPGPSPSDPLPERDVPC